MSAAYGAEVAPSLPPGFRFHPTDEELIVHYLMNQSAAVPCPVPIIAEVDIYKFDPWVLPAKAFGGEKEWYFFSPRDRKYPNGVRPNRAAGSGYWKATGTDKPIVSTKGAGTVGVKKALVFYIGRPPKGTKTEWIMHEYRLTDQTRIGSAGTSGKSTRLRGSMRLDDWVLCRIYKKSTHQLSMDHRGQEQPEDSTVDDSASFMPSSPPPISYQHQQAAMTKSFSITDLINSMDYNTFAQMFDGNSSGGGETDLVAEPDAPCDPMGFIDHNSYHNDSNSNYIQHQDETCKEMYVISSSLKRKSSPAAEGELDAAGTSQSAKKPTTDSRSLASYCNRFESFQFNLLHKPYLANQLLVNTHLEMQ